MYFTLEQPFAHKRERTAAQLLTKFQNTEEKEFSMVFFSKPLFLPADYIQLPHLPRTQVCHRPPVSRQTHLGSANGAPDVCKMTSVD